MADPRKRTGRAPSPKKKRTPKSALPTPKSVLAELRALKGVEDEDFAFFDDPLAWTTPVEEWIPTGNLALDRLTSDYGETPGGYPVNRIVEIASWEGVGKSTLLDQSIAEAQRHGCTCALIDSEQARDPRYTASLGVHLGDLIVYKATTIEQGFAGLESIIGVQEAHVARLAKVGKKPPPMLLVWDSLGGTPTKAEYEGEAGDAHVSVAARSIKMNFRRLTQRIAKARICVVFANQFYENIGFGGGRKSYGGSGIRYFTSLRIWLDRVQQLKQGDRVIGHKVKASLKKTRVCRPRPPAEMGLLYGAGFHNAFTLFEWGRTHGANEKHRWVTQRGSWSYLMRPDGSYESFQGTYLGFADVLEAHPDDYRVMAAQYIGEQE